MHDRSAAAHLGWDTRRLNQSGYGHPWRLQSLSNSRLGYIYLLRNLKNGKCYVGLTFNTSVRWDAHIRDAFEKDSQYPIHRAIRKYGVKNFSAEILDQCAETLLPERERFFVRKLRTHVSQGGYNQTWGGDGVLGLKFSEKSKRKLSASHLAYYIDHPEARARIGKDHRGVKLSPAHRERISAGLLTCARKTLTDDQHELRSAKARARWRNPCYRARQNTAKKDLWSGVRGALERKKASVSAIKRYKNPEERAKDSAVMKKFWLCVDHKKMGEAISLGMQSVIKTPDYRSKMSKVAEDRVAAQRSRKLAEVA